MRGNAEAHEMIAPGSLAAVLEMLAAEPGVWTPIAAARADGGSCRRPARSAKARQPVGHPGFALRRNRIAEHCDRRVRHVSRSARTRGSCADLPLLAKASSWIGSIANQSALRGRNLVNGSPAADSSPALLVYDAEIELVSVRGSRRIPYSDFHTATNRMRWPPMSCSTPFICRGDSRSTGNTCARLERGARWRCRKLR